MIWRYPGGKSKLLKPINELLYPLIKSGGAFIEPFVGGGSVLVQVAKDFPDIKLYVNDKDPAIYAFWKLLQNNNNKDIEAFYALLKTKPTVDLFKELRERGLPVELYERAYYGVFFNRVTFSGIQTSGPIGGYGQGSKYKIDCRYNSARLIKEFEDLRTLFAGRLFVSNNDVLSFVVNMPQHAMYLDPPYYVKGKELYAVFMRPEEHKNLAEILKDRKNWLLSYDMCPEIESLYSWANCQTLAARYSINDRKESWVDKKEYLITPRKSRRGKVSSMANLRGQGNTRTL